MINVYLDDERPCPKGFVLARTVADCIKLLMNNDVSILSLDHDLGDGPSGYDLALYMVEYELYPKTCIVFHTQNPVGRQNMYQLLSRYAPESVSVIKEMVKHVVEE